MPKSPHPLGVSALALLGLLSAAALALGLAPRQAPAAQVARTLKRPNLARVSAKKELAVGSWQLAAEAGPRQPTRFELLPAVRVLNQTTREARSLKLYDAEGRVDERAAQELDQLLCDARDPKHLEVGKLDRRTLQLMYKAAYHFDSLEIEVVSAYRKPGRRREGPHGTGSAIDFRLRDVKAQLLASYLRDIPRTGVGIYTHPKTQFVHIDNREHSFHWLDASPPRRHWREKSIGSANLPRLDQRYTPEDDLPEAVQPTTTPP
ncbi:MAG TPA: DUF882 domain-containing protein [Polyangiaceae bacterium]|nr:DUF882 domain-containing protein [Polyangiaceae bacterium]